MIASIFCSPTASSTASRQHWCSPCNRDDRAAQAGCFQQLLLVLVSARGRQRAIHQGGNPCGAERSDAVALRRQPVLQWRGRGWKPGVCHAGKLISCRPWLLECARVLQAIVLTMCTCTASISHASQPADASCILNYNCMHVSGDAAALYCRLLISGLTYIRMWKIEC